jgi:hypothetical protein
MSLPAMAIAGIVTVGLVVLIAMGAGKKKNTERSEWGSGQQTTGGKRSRCNSHRSRRVKK